MKSKLGLNFFFAIIALVIGSKLVSHFDVQTMAFEQPAIDAVYGVGLVAALFGLVKDFIKKPQDQE